MLDSVFCSNRKHISVQKHSLFVVRVVFGFRKTCGITRSLSPSHRPFKIEHFTVTSGVNSSDMNSPRAHAWLTAQEHAYISQICWKCHETMKAPKGHEVSSPLAYPGGAAWQCYTAACH